MHKTLTLKAYKSTWVQTTKHPEQHHQNILKFKPRVQDKELETAIHQKHSLPNP